MRFDVLTIFPKIFSSYLKESLINKACKKGLIAVKFYNLRDFTSDKRKKVDERPFGGGPGMVMKIEPIYKAVRFIKFKVKSKKLKVEGRKSPPKADSPRAEKARTILFSTRGKKFDAKTARRLAQYSRLILICGRYEGVDERVAEHIADEEISVGDYVLSGGELPAMIVIEAVSRFLPGFLGKNDSLEEIKGSYPTYTRPEVFKPSMGKKWSVPKMLLSGNHKKINDWRIENR